MNYNVKIVEDERGSLISFDDIDSLHLKRFFFIECKQDFWRGDHYHKKGTQQIYIIDGSVEYVLESKDNKITGLLEKGQSITQNTNTKFKFKSITKTSKIAVFCDNIYDVKDYYNDWNTGDAL